MSTTIYRNRCQDPDPRDSHWRELNYPNAADMHECMARCHENKNALGFQFNSHDQFCGCLSVSPGTTITKQMALTSSKEHVR